MQLYVSSLYAAVGPNFALCSCIFRELALISLCKLKVLETAPQHMLCTGQNKLNNAPGNEFFAGLNI